jgi:thymidylate kinase
MFIVFTGLDGSGTSTIAQKVSEMDKGSILLKTPSSEYRDREIIDAEVRKYSTIGHFLYYLSSTVYMSDYIKANFDHKSKNIYCVRYLIDTYVSNKVAGLPLELDYEILGNKLLEPDLTVFVGIDEAVRETRITRRGKSELDKVLDDSERRKAFLELFRNTLDEKKTYFLDNSGNNLEETVKQLYDYISAMQKNNNGGKQQ